VPPFFTLDLATDLATRRVILRLGDGEGRHLAPHELNLGGHPPARWAAAFDTRAHVRRMARTAPLSRRPAPQNLDRNLARLGACSLFCASQRWIRSSTLVRLRAPPRSLGARSLKNAAASDRWASSQKGSAS
jgi:hypothetical protein